MKKLLGILLASAFVFTIPASIYAAEVVTNGEATVYVEPDIAKLSIGVTTEGENTTDAIADNNTKTNSVMEYLKSLGIKESDIETQYFYVNPRNKYDESTGESKIVGYTVNNTIQVTIRDFDIISNVINGSSEKGATNISSIDFDIENKDAYYSEALNLAVNNAIYKGKAIGATLGDKDLKVKNVSENSSYAVTGNAKREMLASDDSASSADVPVSPSEVGIFAKVTVTME
ncbi:MAG: SIMPL domain-containing protein [Lachnospirales bacterium]